MNFRFIVNAILSAAVLFVCVWVFIQLLLIGKWNGGKYDRPIIGILTQPSDPSDPKTSDFIQASYVKYVESFGGRAVHLDWRLPFNETMGQMDEINGLLIPGGNDLKLIDENGEFTSYLQVIERILAYAKIQNDDGDYFPVLAIGKGHQAVHLVETKNKNILVDAPRMFQATVLEWNENVQSRIFNLTAEDVLYQYKTEEVAYYTRSQCLEESAFLAAYGDVQRYKVITKDNTDGVSCISTTDAVDYPIYTVAYHPEKIMFDYSLEGIPRTLAARQFAEDIGFFFIREARNSYNYYHAYRYAAFDYIHNEKHVVKAEDGQLIDQFEFHVWVAPVEMHSEQQSN